MTARRLARLLGARLVGPGAAAGSSAPTRSTAAPAGARLVGPGTAAGGGDAAVCDVEHDSRRVGPGMLFACVPGSARDGQDFAAEAVSAGASAVLAERPVDVGVPVLVVGSVRRALGPAAAAVHGNPGDRLDIAGVTGTNGKTSTVRLLSGLLRAAGRDTAEIGTLTGPLTTPEATDLQRILAGAVRTGCRAAAIEVSSHGLAQHRLDGCRLRVAAFTNLGHDHLDYHGSMQEYFAAKARLFSGDLAERAVIDVTSGWGRRLAALAAERIPVTEVDQSRIEVIGADSRSSRFRWRGRTVHLPLGGAFNRSNAVLAAEMSLCLGLRPDEAVGALASAAPVPGRFETVAAGQDFTVIVDYAHTPDALAAVLGAARELTERRLTVVFGAGGDRDRSKRHSMGAVAERLADSVILTSDNPRSESPARIIDEIAAGMGRAPDLCEPDRRRALRHALAAARRGDTVVVAGKGHETDQEAGGRTLGFDDRAVVAEELRRLAGIQSQSAGQRRPADGGREAVGRPAAAGRRRPAGGGREADGRRRPGGGGRAAGDRLAGSDRREAGER